MPPTQRATARGQAPTSPHAEHDCVWFAFCSPIQPLDTWPRFGVFAPCRIFSIFKLRKEVRTLQRQVAVLSQQLAQAHQPQGFDIAGILKVAGEATTSSMESTTNFVRMVQEIGIQAMAARMGSRGGKSESPTRSGTNVGVCYPRIRHAQRVARARFAATRSRPIFQRSNSRNIGTTTRQGKAMEVNQHELSSESRSKWHSLVERNRKSSDASPNIHFQWLPGLKSIVEQCSYSRREQWSCPRRW